MVQTKLKIGDYEAWVEVENQKIEHYGIDGNEETKVVTGWIASTAGKVESAWCHIPNITMIIDWLLIDLALRNLRGKVSF